MNAAGLYERVVRPLLFSLSPEAAHSSIRFGLGRFTTPDEVDFAIGRVSEAVRKLKASSPSPALRP